jgi:hypothetical protein
MINGSARNIDVWDWSCSAKFRIPSARDTNKIDTMSLTELGVPCIGLARRGMLFKRLGQKAINFLNQGAQVATGKRLLICPI